MLKIYSKSAIKTPDLKGQRELISDGVEVQLLEDFYKSKNTTDYYIKILGEDIENVKVIHTPLSHKDKNYYIDMTLESLLLDEYKLIFHKVCSLAQIIAKRNNSEIIVVLHNSFNLNSIKILGYKYIDLINYLNLILNQYPNIKIGIENVIPIDGLKREVYFTNGALPSDVEVIRDIRRRLKTDRICSVLDICHAISTINFMNLILCNEEDNLELTLKDFFALNEDIICLIHLSYAKGIGQGKTRHGQPFTSSNQDILEKIMDLYYKYNYNCPITIEVLEDDYVSCSNYKITRDTINSYLK